VKPAGGRPFEELRGGPPEFEEIEAPSDVELAAHDVVPDRDGRALEVDVRPLEHEDLPAPQPAVDAEQDQRDVVGRV